ncbi:MAG: hypothetical protein ABIL25_08150 [candidate division WOR-3 bacterium]
MQKCFRCFRFVLVALLACAADIALAQVKVWTARYDAGSNGYDFAQAMALCPDSCIVVTGFSRGNDLGDMATLKLRPNGERAWVVRYQRFPGETEEGLDVAVDDFGNIFVCGKLTSGANVDYVTVKYDSTGVQQWARTYNSGGSNEDVAVAVVPDRKGGCYVTGYSRLATYDYLTFRYRADGSVAWSVRRDGPGHGNDRATALGLSAQGDLYVTGYALTAVNPESLDYCTVKYDTATGSELWMRLYDGTAVKGYDDPKDDRAFALALDPAGNVYVTGRAGEDDTRYDATTVKYSPDGTEVWAHRMNFGNHKDELTSSIAVDAHGYVYCGGYTTEYYGDSGWDMLVFRIGPDGSTDWFNTYDQTMDDDSTAAVGIDENSNVYVAGYSYASDNCLDWAVFKYSPHGNLLWRAAHGVREDDDEPADLVVDLSGELYVAGYDFYMGNEAYTVVKFSEPDAGAGIVVSPTDTVRYGATVRPKVWVRNYGALELDFPVRLDIGTFYFDAQYVTDLAPYESTIVVFKEWRVRDTGLITARCYTQLSGDKDPINDTGFGSVVAKNVWEQLQSVPEGARGRGVKYGGSLAFAKDSLVYALKGYNTCEFYVYNLRTGQWSAKESIPEQSPGGRKKRIKKGACLEWDCGNRIYAVKGSNTLEFWRYQIEGDTGWVPAAEYPSANGRGVKYGASLVYVPSQGRLYSCKGSNTLEFSAYDPATNRWTPMKDVPEGEKNRRCKDGTCMAFDGDHTIYLLKGGRYEFYAYDVNDNTWQTRRELRNSMYSTRKRKVKAGAGLAWDALNARLYATKGGKLSELWYYDPSKDSWVESNDSIPRTFNTPPPYYGSCLEYGNGKLYFLRGNKTREFWVYHANFPLNPNAVDGPQLAASVLPAGVSPRLRVVPNPLAIGAVVHYTLPQAGRVRLGLFDASGRCVANLVDDWRAPGEYHASLANLDLPGGVYLVKLVLGSERSGSTASDKLVVTR